MRSTFRVLFFLKRDKQKKDGKVPIFCRITINRKESRFGIKRDINPKQWNVQSGRAIGRTSEIVEINSLIDNIKASLFNIYNEIQLRGGEVTAEKVKNDFLGVTFKNHKLLELFKRHNDDVKKLIGKTRSKATYQKYEVTRKHLTNFLKEKYNLNDISFREINHLFLTDFEVYLLTTCGCNVNTTAKFMQFFKRIVIIAQKNGWLTIDPFANYTIKMKRVDREYLTHEEVKIIMEKNFSTERLERVRDIFSFCCYTGLSYIDVKNLRQTHIQTGFDDKLWIIGKREKTGVSFNVPLLDIPRSILDKYALTIPDNKLLPVLSNQKMNAYLKEIGDICGIEKDLTFHLARHTFATLALSKGVSIESVSKMLGHTNIKTTQIYARITDVKISADMNSFEEKLETNNSNSNLKLDKLFKCLSMNEKMKLFNLPITLSDDPGRELRISVMWRSLSEEEKRSLWSNTFERDEPTTFTPFKKAAF